jgi:hypothetical protein
MTQIELTENPTHELNEETAEFHLLHPLEHNSWTPSNMFEQKRKAPNNYYEWL